MGQLHQPLDDRMFPSILTVTRTSVSMLLLD